MQRCEPVAGQWSDICVLYCGVEGSTCPDGMVCRATDLCSDGDGGGDGTSTGYWGTTGGDCADALPICVWE